MKFFLCAIGLLSSLILSCTFNYNEAIEESNDFPEISMEKIEYVRVRDGKITARLEAESGERYETKHLMNLKDYKFEQYDTISGDIDSEGSGGKATIEITNNNVHMSEGALIKVDTEDFELEAVRLDWDDKSRVLKGGEKTPVQLRRGNSDEVSGDDFLADVRKRSWVFGANVHGSYESSGAEEQTGTGQTGAGQTGAGQAGAGQAGAGQAGAGQTEEAPKEEIKEEAAETGLVQ